MIFSEYGLQVRVIGVVGQDEVTIQDLERPEFTEDVNISTLSANDEGELELAVEQAKDNQCPVCDGPYDLELGCDCHA